MTSILGSRRDDGFSETARFGRGPDCEAGSHRRQLDAVRSHDRTMAVAIRGWRFADDLAERAAERPEPGDPNIETDIGDASVRLAQQEHRALDASTLQLSVRRLAKDSAEAADAVGF